MKGNGYLAAAIVDFLREELIRRGDSFSFETVMSHRSKIEFFKRARASGYKTYLYFVCTNSAELNIARVRSRVGMGGYSVPEDKIRERYVRCLELAREAVAHSYRAYFFDNSGPEPIWLAESDPNGNGLLKPKPDEDRIPEPDELPRWFREWVWDDWNPILATTFQVDDDRPVMLSPPHRPVIHSDHAWRCDWGGCHSAN